MAVDLQIELFSLDLFRNMWYACDMIKFVPPRMKRYSNKSYDEKSDCCPEHIYAVWCRRYIYQNTFYFNLERDYNEYSECGVDFYWYIKKNLNRYLPYPDLNIFDKILMTCAVVTEMGYCCYARGNRKYIYHAPLCWAMFFDTVLKGEFYAAGGWITLRTHAAAYISEFLRVEDILSVYHYQDDLLNIQSLFKLSIHDYDESKLIETFIQKKWKMDSKRNNFCVKCFPIFNMLDVFNFSMNIDSFKVVEGYLQICLRLSTFAQNLRCNLTPEGEFDYSDKRKLTCFNRSDCTTEKNILHITEMIESRRDNKYKFNAEKRKNITTHEVIEGLFSVQTKKSELDLCMFCGQNTDPLEKHLTQKIFNNQITETKSVILKTISEMFSKRSNKLLEETFDFKKQQANPTIAKEEFSPILEIHHTFNQADIAIEQEQLKRNHERLISETADEEFFQTPHIFKSNEQTTDEKNALRMFLALGVEPAKSCMLSIIRDNKNNPTFNGDKQSVNKATRTVQEEASERTLKNKNSKKKKKTRHSYF